MKNTDLWLYVGIGGCTAASNYFAIDAAKEFVSPLILFWLVGAITIINAMLLAAKMKRSNGSESK